MVKLLSASVVVTGFILIISGICFKPMVISKGQDKKKLNKSEKSLKGALENITNKKILKAFLNYLAHNKELQINRFATRVLELSEAGISLQQLYFLKIAALLICTLLVMLINYSNTNYQIKKLILSSEKTLLSQDNSYDESKYILYKQIVESVGIGKLSEAGDTQKYYLVKEAMTDRLKTSEEYLIEDKTEWFVKTWKEVHKIQAISNQGIVCILLAPFLPEIILIFIWLLRGCIYKKEIIKLEYIFELLARVAGIKTSDIIFELEKSSKIYSKYLHEFRIMFQYDKKSAFGYLKGSNVKSLSRLATVLEIYSQSDRELALQILDREVMERDEALIITSEESIDFIDLVAFLSIAPLVYELARLMIDPMLGVIYKAFEFI